MWPYFCKHDFLKNGIRSRFSKYKRMVCSISLINWFWAETKWTHLYLVKHNCKFIHRHWREIEILNRTQICSCCPIIFRVTESFSLSLASPSSSFPLPLPLSLALSSLIQRLPCPPCPSQAHLRESNNQVAAVTNLLQGNDCFSEHFALSCFGSGDDPRKKKQFRHSW